METKILCADCEFDLRTQWQPSTNQPTCPSTRPIFFFLIQQIGTHAAFVVYYLGRCPIILIYTYLFSLFLTHILTFPKLLTLSPRTHARTRARARTIINRTTTAFTTLNPRKICLQWAWSCSQATRLPRHPNQRTLETGNLLSRRLTVCKARRGNTFLLPKAGRR